MNRAALLLIPCLAAAALQAQPGFERTFGGAADDFGHTALALADGFLLAGYTASFGSGANDAYLVRTDAQGETLWTRVYGSDADDWSFRAIPTADGGCAVVGYAIRSGRADLTLLKVDDRGDSAWCRTYGGSSDDLGYGIELCPDSGFIIAGATFSYGTGRPNIYVIRTDALGDTLWTRTYGGAGEEYGFSVAVTRDSGFVIAGWTTSFGARGGDVYLIRTDSHGDTLWTRMYGGAGNDYCHTVRQTPDGGYILAGSTFSYGAGGPDLWLVRTDPDGDTLWTRTYGGTGYDLGHSVDLAADGGFAFAGVTRSFGAGDDDVLLVRTDSLGDTLWTRTFGGAEEERAFSVTSTADRGFALGGSTRSFGAGGADAWLVRTDSLGRVALAEPGPVRPLPHAGPTILRGTLFTPRTPGAGDGSLYTSAGTLALHISSGCNDISRLAPGFYFLRNGSAGPPQKLLLLR
jgi:hypothetical protein